MYLSINVAILDKKYKKRAGKYIVDVLKLLRESNIKILIIKDYNLFSFKNPPFLCILSFGTIVDNEQKQKNVGNWEVLEI